PRMSFHIKDGGVPIFNVRWSAARITVKVDLADATLGADLDLAGIVRRCLGASPALIKLNYASAAAQLTERRSVLGGNSAAKSPLGLTQRRKSRTSDRCQFCHVPAARHARACC